MLQKVGSAIVRLLSGTEVPDVTSGFRAFSRVAALRLSVDSNFSYTVETLIQAGRNGMSVSWVPIDINPKRRPSRLFKSPFNFIYNQVVTMTRAFLFHRPWTFFSVLSAMAFTISLVASTRVFYYLYFIDPALRKFKIGTGILALFAALVGVMFIIAGLIGIVQSGLKRLLEDVHFTLRKETYKSGKPPSHVRILYPTGPSWRKNRINPKTEPQKNQEDTG